MKDLKFRAWFESDKQFLYSDDLKGWPRNTQKLCRFFHMVAREEYDNNNEKEVVVQAWTGLLDKNGKEIYEGDIINYDDSYIYYNPGVIVWSKYEDLGWYMARLGKDTDEDCIKELYQNVNGINVSEDDPLSRNPLFSDKVWCLEVIGNIYQNINLIKPIGA